MFLFVDECDFVGAVSNIKCKWCYTLVITASVVFLKIILSSSYVWRCLDGSHDIPLFGLMISAFSSSEIFVVFSHG